MVKKLIFKIILLISPLLLIGIYFIADDPMKIIHDTKNPVSRGVLMNDRLFQARYLSKKTKDYNSFIFGSSRSRAFHVIDWRNYLEENAEIYHMGVNDETLYGLERKINFLKTQGYPLKNIFIQLDHRLLSLTKNHEAHIFREYYTLTDETAASYYRRFFTAFLNVDFLKNYTQYKRTGIISQSDDQSFLWDPGFDFNVQTGDIIYTRMENQIAKDSVCYYKELKLAEYKREFHVGEPVITKEAESLLKRIDRLLSSEKAKVKVVISPNFDQIALNQKDVMILQRIFGKSNVYNFSGLNELTQPLGNYYEHKHFKPFVANRILNQIYN